jgi:hypothetical protein
MAVYLSMRSLNVCVDFTILSDCGRMIQLLLIVFAFCRLLDLVSNHALHHCISAHAGGWILLAGSGPAPCSAHHPAEL